MLVINWGISSNSTVLLLHLILNLGEKNEIFLPDVFDGVLCFCHHKFVDPLMYLHAIKVLYRQAYFNTTPLLDNLDGMRESQPFTASIQSGRKIRYPLCRGGVSFPNYSKCLGWDLDEGLPPPRSTSCALLFVEKGTTEGGGPSRQYLIMCRCGLHYVTVFCLLISPLLKPQSALQHDEFSFE